ncbi:MAG: HK97 gp10 family phage protein [Fervidobacterium sp.]
MADDIQMFLAKKLDKYASNIHSRWKWMIENVVDPSARAYPASTTDKLANSLVIRSTGVFEREIGTNVQYAEYVEKGRSAGAVPQAVISKWLLQKMRRYGWSVTDFYAVVKKIVDKITTQGYKGWEHLETVVEDERLFDRSFGGELNDI